MRVPNFKWVVEYNIFPYLLIPKTCPYGFNNNICEKFSLLLMLITYNLYICAKN